MEAGKLDRRVKIQAAEQVSDGMGGVTETWTDITTVWARIEPLRGNALFYAQQNDSKVTQKITIRYISGIKQKHRILCGTTIYQIDAVIDVASERRMLELMCYTLENQVVVGTIATPTITSPVDDAEDVVATGPFTCSAFSVTGATDTHITTRWQITEEADTQFADPVLDVVAATALTSLSLADGELDPDTTYLIRCRHDAANAGSSNWSEAVTFTTAAEA